MEFDKIMKKRVLVTLILILTVVSILSMTACSGLFGDSDPTRYYIDIGQVEDARTASIVANNTIASCVRVITEYAASTSASSGFVITEDGYVVTNRHCVVRYTYTNGKTSDVPQFPSERNNPMRAKYFVVFADNKQYEASLVEWSDDADIAVLKIDNGKIIKDKFQPLVFETERELYYGERVYTIGNPENIGLIFTELAIASPAMRLSEHDTFNSIVLDGNINHGNSGGAIFNAHSRISGIVYARIDGNNSDAYGIGCAIPTSEIIKFLKSIKVSYKTTPTSASSGN